MKLTLRLSASLLSIYGDSGAVLPETIDLEADAPLTVGQILEMAHISHLLSPMISVNGVICGSNDQLIKEDSVLTLYGPLQGG